MTSIRESLATATTVLASSDSPQLDAEVLLAYVLQRPRSYLYTWPDRNLSTGELGGFQALVERRRAGTPVAHLTGRKEFWSLELEVTPDTLIPRPDTETLVSTVLALLPATGPATVADLGTGSGAIALALAHERPSWQVVAVDRSAPALAVTQRNSRRLGLNTVYPLQGDWCAALASGKFDLIACNPPYVATDDPHLQRGDVRHEPRCALAAGANGLDDLRQVISTARRCLRNSGWLVLEHGYDQATAVQDLLSRHSYRSVKTHTDLSGHTRVTSACRSG